MGPAAWEWNRAATHVSHGNLLSLLKITFFLLEKQSVLIVEKREDTEKQKEETNGNSIIPVYVINW